ncbi:MAG: hypothetical protein R6V05_15405 [Candidatus Brocadiia bacterium]
MTLAVAMDSAEWRRFSLPHVLCLLGEQQYLIEGGSVLLGTDLRLTVQLQEAESEFSIRFSGGLFEADDPCARAAAEEHGLLWQEAIAEGGVPGIEPLVGTHVVLRFDPRVAGCPPGLLLSAPEVGVALALATLTGSGRLEAMTPDDVARRACRLMREARPAVEHPDRYHGPALAALHGGARYISPEGAPVNVQQLLPPASLLLCMSSTCEEGYGGPSRDEAVGRALAAATAEGRGIMEGGDAGMEALFALGDDVLEQEQITMLYGLLRVRQMIGGFMEHLGERFVDNDRLAEICDEESEILSDYFGFPAGAFTGLRQRAVEAGALGTKLTWAFGGCPAAVVLAPGRRQEVLEALREEFPEAHVMPVDVEPTGLLWGEPGADETL